MAIKFNRESLQFEGLDEKVMDQLKRTYRGVDVESELEKMKLWLLSAKGATRKGNIQFIMNWLKGTKPSLPVPDTNEKLLYTICGEMAKAHRNTEWLHELNTKH